MHHLFGPRNINQKKYILCGLIRLAATKRAKNISSKTGKRNQKCFQVVKNKPAHLDANLCPTEIKCDALFITAQARMVHFLGLRLWQSGHFYYLRSTIRVPPSAKELLTTVKISENCNQPTFSFLKF